jgi:hypothetical protein
MNNHSNTYLIYNQKKHNMSEDPIERAHYSRLKERKMEELTSASSSLSA